MLYRFLRFLTRISVRVFFRRIEVEGVENVPSSGPVLLVPNHPNAVVDALVVLISLKRPVTLTAKSTLAHIPVIGPIIKANRVILFHRRKDAAMGADPSKNPEAIAQCRQRLERGEAILIFPEGQSHSDPKLRPLRTGAARIALETVRSGQAPGLLIVPVGLHFPEKDRFRSDVWVRFGKPLDPHRWQADNPESGPKELTAQMEKRIRDLTLNFERRPDSVLLMWAAEILEPGARPPGRLGVDRSTVSRRLRLVRLLNEGYRQLKDDQAETIGRLRRRVRAYRLELRRLGIKPSEVYIQMPVWRVARFVARELVIVAVGLPIAAWGVLNHFVPAAIIRIIAVNYSAERDKWASNVVFPTMVLIPLFYTLQITAALFWLPLSWAVLYAVSLPLSGLFAILYRDRVGNIWQRSRTFFLFLRDPGLRERLGHEGRSIIGELTELGQRMDQGKAGPAGSPGDANRGQDSIIDSQGV
ncbi:MAG: 1-acyl-sn-glycerol-3-phosphate acyltransferase [bacterium]|nr:MAG: 1-acyl-sn-glycerol-3-phosphate acyltransferase [bacterium]